MGNDERQLKSGAVPSLCSDGVEFRLHNGMKVVNVKNDSGIAVFGIAALAGSNFETPSIAGVAHFSEHMFFKGTTSRDWRQINKEFARLGVYNNAWTDNTEVYYYTACPKENIGPVIELMMDMLFNSTLPEEEIEKERTVILEEKKMYEDDPSSSFHDIVRENFLEWDKGHHIIGTEETINGITRQNIIDYNESKYTRENLALFCCGDVDMKELMGHIEKNTPADHPYLRSTARNHPDNSFYSDIIQKPDRVKLTVERENISQSVLSMQGVSVPSDSNDAATAAILYKALGGGMYSLLFERLREELGLCYSVGMMHNCVHYPIQNSYYLYGYTSPEKTEEFMDETEKIFETVLKEGIDEDLFECAKIDMLSSILRQAETSQGRLGILLKKLLVEPLPTGIHDMERKMRDVTNEGVNTLAQKIFVDYNNNYNNWAIMVPKGE